MSVNVSQNICSANTNNKRFAEDQADASHCAALLPVSSGAPTPRFPARHVQKPLTELGKPGTEGRKGSH